MIHRGPWLALVLAAYLLVAGTFAFFAVRTGTLHAFLDRIIANQERLIDHVTRHEQCMVRESADLAEILRRLPIPERK